MKSGCPSRSRAKPAVEKEILMDGAGPPDLAPDPAQILYQTLDQTLDQSRQL